MTRMNRRRFTWVATGGFASAALVACGADTDEDLTPTRISSVQGAPPTLAPNATPFSSDEGGEEATPVEQAGGGGEPITVTGLDTLRFDPETIDAAPGQVIHFVNGGALEHNFVVDELGIEGEIVGGGEEYDVTVPDDAEVGAEYEYYCSVPGHREGGMVGILTIVEGGGEAAAAPAEEEAPAEEGAAAGGGETAVAVSAFDLGYDPLELAIAADTDVEITLTNDGSLQHDFVIEDTDFATELLDGGASETITVNLPAGEYVYFCSVPGHRESGMEGTLTVG